MDKMVDPRTWLEVIPLDECWELLAGERVARLAVVVDQRPEIFPVNSAVTEERTVVFRTAEGTKLESLGDVPDVALEVDGTDEPASGPPSGWSVLIAGSARHVRDAESVRRFEGLDLIPWAPGHKSVWVEIRPRSVSGRRINPPAGEEAGS
ncbi:MAG: pyridoxamine 5'-phosphate oxidase family protein [Actinomycetota bacterium]